MHHCCWPRDWTHICQWSGNHAAAVALAARIRGIKAHIVVPRNVPACKLENVKRYGGQITLCEPSLEARQKEAARIQQSTGAVLVHSSNDPDIIRCVIWHWVFYPPLYSFGHTACKKQKHCFFSYGKNCTLLMILTVAVAKVLLLLSFWSKFHCWMPSSFLSVVCFQTQQKPCERCTEKCLNVLPQSCTKKFKICWHWHIASCQAQRNI